VHFRVGRALISDAKSICLRPFNVVRQRGSRRRDPRRSRDVVLVDGPVSAKGLQPDWKGTIALAGGWRRRNGDDEPCLGGSRREGACSIYSTISRETVPIVPRRTLFSATFQCAEDGWPNGSIAQPRPDHADVRSLTRWSPSDSISGPSPGTYRFSQVAEAGSGGHQKIAAQVLFKVG